MSTPASSSSVACVWRSPCGPPMNDGRRTGRRHWSMSADLDDVAVGILWPSVTAALAPPPHLGTPRHVEEFALRVLRQRWPRPAPHPEPGLLAPARLHCRGRGETRHSGRL